MTAKLKISDHFQDNEIKYIGDDNAASLESLPSFAWPALVEACGDDGLGRGEQPGIDCWVAVTHESLADFDDSRGRHWSEPGRRSEFTAAGFPAVKYERIQLRRGDTRKDMIVIDFGEIRAALT